MGPQAQPPQQAAGSEDEEGMDEPPEVREFMQELGNDGGRGAAGADAAAGPLPMVSCELKGRFLQISEASFVKVHVCSTVQLL